MVVVYARVAERPMPWACTVNEYEPAVVGVPDKRPDELASVTPGGSWPPTTIHVYCEALDEGSVSGDNGWL